MATSDAVPPVETSPGAKVCWNGQILQKHFVSAKVSTLKMREQILEHIVERNRARVSAPLVWSQLGRLTFRPRSFAFPLAQSQGSDSHYGHKHFLANVVWACTDRALKRTNEENGTGALFEYLDARRLLNKGRHNRETVEIAECAASWLDPTTLSSTHSTSSVRCMAPSRSLGSWATLLRFWPPPTPENIGADLRRDGVDR
jgi:hypothetical protein